MDANNRSLSRGSRFILRKVNCAGIDGRPKKFGGVPMVRIHLPPAGSQERTAVAKPAFAGSQVGDLRRDDPFPPGFPPQRSTGSEELATFMAGLGAQGEPLVSTARNARADRSVARHAG